MNIYLISRSDDGGYDTYDSAVVATETEAEARMMHPGGPGYEWDGIGGGTWIDAEVVKIQLIGTAVDGIPAGVICASFNAG